MNILYVNNVMEFGGVEKCIIQLSKGFKSENKVVVCTAGGPLVKELESMNVKHYEINNTDLKNPIVILKNILKIAKIVKSEKIDLVHSHHRMTTLYCKLLSKVMNFRLIHTQHLCIEDKVKLTKFVLKKIPIITVSNGAKINLVNNYYIQEKNIVTIYNTIETSNSNYDIDEKLIELKKNGNFVVAHISRLVEYKGIYDFLEITKELSIKDRKIKFVIFGDGPEKNNVLEYIKLNKLQNVVFLLGNKDNIINQFKYIDLVLLCSYIEGLPLVPLEAFSQQVPVIATDIGGTNEEVIDGVNGFLVEKKDISDFVEKILLIYNDDNKYKSMKAGCIKVFNEKFNEKKYYDEHTYMYNNILK